MHVELQNVGVTYDNTQVLRDISFTIAPGERVALIGATGSGKSTIANLVGLLKEPDQGQILIDEVPSTIWCKQEVLKYIGHIVQNVQLLSGTVLENVSLTTHQPEASYFTEAEVWEVLDTISTELRDAFGLEGIKRNVGKQGLALSGGQAQRVCIARSLIKRPHLLIVDEATSSLDAVTQDAVQAGIAKYLHPRASALIIAHRLSTLRNCTKFVVLRPLSKCKEGESQVEATATTMEALYEVSPSFREMAKHEGVSF